MSSVEWREMDLAPCPECGGRVRVKAGAGRIPTYCSKLCSRRASYVRRVMRQVAEDVGEAHASRPEPPEPRELTVGEEFAVFREQRRLMRERRIDQCKEALATGMESPGTRHSSFEWDEAHWYARKRLGLD